MSQSDTPTLVEDDEIRRNAARFSMQMLLLVCCAHCCNDLIQAVIPATLPLLKENYMLTFAEVGLITMVVQITASLLQPMVGWAADHRSFNQSLTVGMGVTFTGLIALSNAHSYEMILISVAFIGAGSAIFHPEAARRAQRFANGRPGLAQAVFQVGGNGGAAFGPLAAALILTQYGQDGIALFAAFAAVAMILLFYIGRMSLKVPAGLKSPTEKSASTTPLSSIFRGATGKLFLLLFVLMFSKMVFTSSLSSYLTFYVIEKFGVSVSVSQYVLFAFLAAAALGTVLGGPLTDKFGRRRIIFLSIVIEKFGVSVSVSQYVLFAFLAAAALGTVLGGPLTDKFGRRRIIFLSIVGAAPFALALPYVNFTGVIILTIIAAIIISSAFSAILVSALHAAPGRTGLVSGVFFGFAFGLGGVITGVLGVIADHIGIESVFQYTTLMPLLGIVALALPKTINGRPL